MDIVTARSIPNPNGPHRVTGRVVSSDRIIEAFRHKHDKRSQSLVIAGESLINGNIDVGWLRAASETYAISEDPRDYVLVDIPIVTVDVPNRNLQAFPFEEVSYFDPLYGKMVYQTFNAKPCHQDHDNKDPLRAKGVIFDSSMEFVPAYNVWKIRILSGWDRTKDRNLVDAIVRKKRTGYSMGALVENFVPLVAGTLVLTEDGYIPIEAVRDGMMVETVHGLRSSGGAVFNDYLPVITIETEAGPAIEAAPNHPILVLNSDLSTEWKEVGDLQVGDFIGIKAAPSEAWPKSLVFDYTPFDEQIDEDGFLTCGICEQKFRQLQRHVPSAHHISIEEYRRRHGKVINASLYESGIDYPKQMMPELASLIGYFLSEGSWGESGSFVGMSGNDGKPDLLRHYRTCFISAFGKEPAKFDASLGIKDFMHHLGLEQGGARGKNVPWSIMQAPKNCVIAFLRAFWEGDGSARVVPGGVSYCSTSDQLLRDIQILLLRLGIPSKWYENHQTTRTPTGSIYDLRMFYLNIFGKSVDRFAEIIGATSEERKSDLDRICGPKRNDTQFGEEIPFLRETLDVLYRTHHHGDSGGPYYKLAQGGVGKANLYRVALKDNSIVAYGHLDRYDLIENIRKLDPVIADRVDGLLESRLMWTPVTGKEISHVLQPCYCVSEVQEGHNFVANGIVVHNCSNCGQIDTNLKRCPCMTKYGGPGHVMPNGNLVYQQCVGANFIENSSVDDPADITAETEAIWG